MLRQKLLINPGVALCDGTQLDKASFAAKAANRQSLLLERAAKQTLNRIQTAGNLTDKTLAICLKRASIGTQQHIFSAQSSALGFFGDNVSLSNDNKIQIHLNGNRFLSEAELSDMFGWYQIVISIDNNIPTVWVNGRPIAVPQVSTYAHGSGVFGSDGIRFTVGAIRNYLASDDSENCLDAYVTAIAYADGVVVSNPYGFGEFNITTGQWEPKDPDTTGWTDNSFYLSGKANYADDFCNVIDWTGNGGSLYMNNISTSGADFALVFFNGGDRRLFDTLRGDDNELRTNTTAAQSTQDNLSFIGGGVVVDGNRTNSDGDSYAGLFLKHDPSRGFNQTIHTLAADRLLPHGGTTPPDAVITRVHTEADGWDFWMRDEVSDNQRFRIELTGTVISTTGQWEQALFDNNNIKLGSGHNPNVGKDYYSSFFWDIPGVCKVDKFTAVGTTLDVDFGFIPKAVIWKRKDSSGNWALAYNLTPTGSKITTLSSTSGVSNDAGTFMSSPTNMRRTGLASDAEYFIIAFADTTYLKEFTQSTIGTVTLTPANLPGWENQYTDTPWNNHAVMNTRAESYITDYAQGNLLAPSGNISGSGTHQNGRGSTFGIHRNTGVYYAEAQLQVPTSSVVNILAVMDSSNASINTELMNPTPASGEANAGDMYAIEIDSDAWTGKVTNMRTGTVFNSTLNANIDVAILNSGDGASGESTKWLWNFGQKPFLYPPAEPYGVLSSVGVSSGTVIQNPEKAFKKILYSGTGAAQTVTGPGFEPVMIWTKKLTGVNDSWKVDIKLPDGTWVRLAFDSNAVPTGTNFSLVSADRLEFSGNNSSNSPGENYISYCFSDLECAGFGLSYYDGDGSATRDIYLTPIGTPGIAFIKSLDTTDAWTVYNGTLGEFNDTTSASGAVTSSSNVFLGVGDKVLTVGNNLRVNRNLTRYVAITFSPVPGFVFCGHYDGNGNTDGRFINTGMRPGFSLFKRLTGTGGWAVTDSARNQHNPVTKEIYLHSSNPESLTDMDYTACGIKMRNNSSPYNASATYMCLAIADAPPLTANAV